MARAEIASGEAPARIALAGNPSDGYGGAVLALAVGSHGVRASARPSARLEITPDSRLVQAVVERFARELEPAAARTAIEWSTTIPRDVGLGGSSAIVIAVLRALCVLLEVDLGRDELARLALAIEVEDLGIVAGLQDRVVQTYGGLVFMDFANEQYERLDPALLPPLLIAWRPDAGGSSGHVHAPLRDRFERGDPEVLTQMTALGQLAREARSAVLNGDHAGLGRCLDASFDARRRMLTLDRRHVELIECARRAGASANYTGSGGAIVAAPDDGEEGTRSLARELSALGCRTVTP